MTGKAARWRIRWSTSAPLTCRPKGKRELGSGAKGSSHHFQIGNERFVGGAPPFRVWCAQHRGRMDRGDDALNRKTGADGTGGLEHLPAMLRQLELRSHDRLRCGRAE